MTARLVYATDRGRLCPDCGSPLADCHCHTRAPDVPVPAKVTAKLRVEKKGRGGKIVTVVDGLPRNTAFLTDLCQELKRACGCGGAVADGTIELQGDLRQRIRERLLARGMTVKG